MSNKIALDALTKFVKNAEQSVFEDWLEAKSPSGDVEQVQIQWEGSSEYREFCERAWAVPLSAAIAALQAEPQGWRPIETAPKDAHALLWIDIVIGQPLVVQGCWFHDDDADEKGWIDLDGNVLNATHWMPLPAPPKD